MVARKTATGLAVDFTATPTTTTTVDPVAFIAIADGGPDPYTYAWDFGNGVTSTDPNPVYSYPQPGTYDVTLCVTDADAVQVCNTKNALVTVEQGTAYAVPAKAGRLRVATLNASMFRDTQGRLGQDLSDGTDLQIQKIAEIIQRTDPDVLLINEFDYDASGQSVADFLANYLEVGQNGAAPIVFGHQFTAESNTGIPSGQDLNDDGDLTDPEDAFGYGVFAGQYGMLLLSKHPIDEANVRTFQKFLWKDMPQSALPDGYYSPEAEAVLRLSSKSHWDVPVDVDGTVVHILCSHPTPPVFDDGDAAQGGRRLERAAQP